MLHENDYQAILTDKGIVVFLIKARDDEPEKPVLLYDGRNHATFYRQSNQTILFDYLNPKVVDLLFAAKKALIFEVNEKRDVVRSYEVFIKQVVENYFTDGL